MAYAIEFAAEAVDDLNLLRPFDRIRVLQTIEEQLTHQPTVLTRNRKPLQQALPEGMLASRPGLVVWELKIQQYRVFYDVEETTGVLVIRVVLKGTLDTELAIKKSSSSEEE